MYFSNTHFSHSTTGWLHTVFVNLLLVPCLTLTKQRFDGVIYVYIFGGDKHHCFVDMFAVWIC